MKRVFRVREVTDRTTTLIREGKTGAQDSDYYEEPHVLLALRGDGGDMTILVSPDEPDLFNARVGDEFTVTLTKK